MRKLLIIVIAGGCIPVFAQTDEDALRFSMTEYMGSARVLGSGSAFTALGADLGGISLNPAGLGQYRTSEILFSPSFHVSTSEASFHSETHAEDKLNFNISNFGLVISKSSGGGGRSPRAPWEAFNWSFGYNRMANYNDHVMMSGVNAHNSLIDRFIEEANGTFASDLVSRFPFGAGVAYEAYLFDPNTDSVTYIGRVPNGGVTQTKEIKSRGSNDEWFLAWGGNLSNKVMFGASLGLPSVKYEEESWYTEEDVADSIPGFTKFTQYSWLQTRGAGINGKLGVVGLLGKMVRVGVAFHSPSFLRLTDGYYTYIDNEEPDITYESPEGSYVYWLRTPWRANAGIAVLFEQAGFVSVDYEYVDYGRAAYRFRPIDQEIQDEVNGQISSKYGPASIIRVGGELVLGAYRARAGFQFSGSPFKPEIADTDADYSRMSYSGGVGYRGKVFFADVAYVVTSTSQLHVPYVLADPDEIVGGALIDKMYHNIIFTLGAKLR